MHTIKPATNPVLSIALSFTTKNITNTTMHTPFYATRPACSGLSCVLRAIRDQKHDGRQGKRSRITRMARISMAQRRGEQAEDCKILYILYILSKKTFKIRRNGQKRAIFGVFSQKMAHFTHFSAFFTEIGCFLPIFGAKHANIYIHTKALQK
ncbi:MAG: hypothetical protein EOM20_20440 [Spartobacteria bacterium]|nr:hypothetical protein [Spartobacteria bacterium]